MRRRIRFPSLLLAAEQGATYVEYDLQPTKDGVLVLLHDETLERTTDVEDVFPQRFRETKGADGAMVKRWYLADFTFAEVQKLDAGAWFDAKFKGTRVPSHVADDRRDEGQVRTVHRAESAREIRREGLRRRRHDARGAEEGGTRSALRQREDARADSVIRSLQRAETHQHAEDEAAGPLPLLANAIR